MFWATDSAIKKRITHDCQLYSSASFGKIVTETDGLENLVSCLGPDFFLTREVVGLISHREIRLRNGKGIIGLWNSWALFVYSRISNKRAAQIINFLKISNLHVLITSCTFINL